MDKIVNNICNVVVDTTYESFGQVVYEFNNKQNCIGGNFNINNIKLENIKIPEEISEFKNKKSGIIIDLMGRCISDTEGLKGIYIVNGKKTIIK